MVGKNTVFLSCVSEMLGTFLAKRFRFQTCYLSVESSGADSF